MTAVGPIGLDRVLATFHRIAPNHRIHTDTLTGERLELLLFMAQAYNLAWSGQPLFNEPIVRTGDSVQVALPLDFETAELSGEGHAGTLGDVLHSHGDMSSFLLRATVTGSRPWQQTDIGDPILVEALHAWALREQVSR